MTTAVLAGEGATPPPLGGEVLHQGVAIRNSSETVQTAPDWGRLPLTCWAAARAITGRATWDENKGENSCILAEKSVSLQVGYYIFPALRPRNFYTLLAV